MDKTYPSCLRVRFLFSLLFCPCLIFQSSFFISLAITDTSAEQAPSLEVAPLQSLKKLQDSPTHHGILISVCLCLQMPTLVAGEFKIQVPNEPIVAIQGGEAELPCFLSPRQNAKDMQIHWSRSLSSQVVHLYKERRDHPGMVMKEYSGRTKLVRDAMDKGIVILRIFNVQLSDDGLYRCGFQHGSLYNEALVELKVAVIGSDPQFHVEVTESRETQLECKSEGWFPQPKVQCINSHGEKISPLSENQTQDQDGLFQVTTLLLLRDPSEKSMTCSIWNPVLNEKKEKQVSIAVAEPSGSFHIGILIGSAPSLILFIIVLCLCRNRQRTRKADLKNCDLNSCTSEEDDKIQVLVKK